MNISSITTQLAAFKRLKFLPSLFLSMAVQQTSIDAYARLKDSGKLNERQEKVYEWLEKYGPCTSRELHMKIVEYEGVSEAAIEGPNYVKPRLSELKDEEAIETCGKRKCSVTGITVNVLQTV